MVSMIYFGTNLYEHRIETWIRFYKTRGTYEDYASDNEDFGALLLTRLNDPDELLRFARNNFDTHLEFTERTDLVLPGLNGAFSIKIKYADSVMTVQDARHIEPHNGGNDVTNAFNCPMKIAVITNLYNKVRERNVEELNKMFSMYKTMAAIKY